jgi:tryptophan 2,3-dioxygenase
MTPDTAKEQLSYDTYLQVDKLLSLQQPLSSPPHHDEMLFIIIHQVYELWFKQLLHEIEAVMRDLAAGDLLRVAKHFKRLDPIQRLIETQVDILETMTPHEFNAFRDNLNPASGFQSLQFREIEFIAGLRKTEMLKHIQMNDEQRARLERRLAEPSLYDRVKDYLRGRGFSVGTHDELIATFRTIYSASKDHYDLYLLLEELIEFDERFLLWRGRHIRMVERMIGAKRGTGGSLGATYLATTLDNRFFPELWEVRTYLGKGY